nr:glycosyltransferase [Lewinella sp. JB7]
MEKHTVQLATGLGRLGHDVTLIARPGSPPIGGLEVVTHLTGYRQAMRFVREQGFDLLHNNSINGTPTFLAYRVNCPVVTTLHTPPYRRQLPGILTARLLRGSAFVAISEHLAQRWRIYTGKSCTVIHNGIDTEEWPYAPRARPQTAIWYGRITPEKGTEFALEACRRAGYHLQIAGPINDDHYFRQKIAPGLGDHASYLGHLDQRAIAQLSARSSVGLFTSVWDEPFGLVLLEMLACGVPVAGFASGAVPELMSPDVSRLVPVGDVAGLANVIPAASMLDPRNCRSFVESRFPLHRMISAYEQLYLRLVAE